MWDRLFDLYVMTPMQTFTADLLRPEGRRDADSVADARASAVGLRVRRSIATLKATLGERDSFSMADCAAAPALFYAVTYVPLPPQHVHLILPSEKIDGSSSVARVIDEARPLVQVLSWARWFVSTLLLT